MMPPLNLLRRRALKPGALLFAGDIGSRFAANMLDAISEDRMKTACRSQGYIETAFCGLRVQDPSKTQGRQKL
jgi:hypothetical protein